MPLLRRSSSVAGDGGNNLRDLTIRIDHSGAKLENQRLKNSMHGAVEEIQRRKYRRNADQTFDIKAARREANLIFNQAKMIKATEGLWEDALKRGKSTKSSSTIHSAFTASASPSMTKLSKPSQIKRSRPQSSTVTSKSIFEEGDDEKSTHKSDAPDAEPDEETSSALQEESFEEHRSEEEKDFVEDDFVNPYRSWVQQRKRPISAFLPLEQIPLQGRFEPPKATRLIKSAQPRARLSDMKDDDGQVSGNAGASKSVGSRQHKRRPLTAAADGSDAQRVRSFQHLKELVHIDSLSRARYIEARSRLLEVKNEQRVLEDKLLAERIQAFYVNVDALVKSTKDALRGPQFVDSRFPLQFHLAYDSPS